MDLPRADRDELIDEARAVSTLARRHVDAVHEFLERFGADSLDLALASGHLFDGDMRIGSKLALRHSRDYHEAGAPHSIVMQVAPGAKKTGERLSISLVTGPVQMALDFPNLRTA